MKNNTAIDISSANSDLSTNSQTHAAQNYAKFRKCLQIFVRSMVLWLSGNAYVLIKIVTQRWTWLVLGWVTIRGWINHPGWYIASHLGLLPDMGG